MFTERKEEYQRKYRAANRSKMRAYSKKYHWAHREATNAYMIKRNRRLKQKVMDALGGKCCCCKETILEFLCVDHINGDGAAHRKKTNSSRTTIYSQVLKHKNMKNHFRVLCWNCNWATHRYEICPHKKEKSVAGEP